MCIVIRCSFARSRVWCSSLPARGPQSVSEFLLLAVSRSISGGRRLSNFSTSENPPLTNERAAASGAAANYPVFPPATLPTMV